MSETFSHDESNKPLYGIYDDVKGAYQQFAESVGGAFMITGSFDGSISGGNDCPCSAGWVGRGEMTLDTLIDYSDTLNATIKDKIIDAFVNAITSILGAKIEGKTREEKIKSIFSIIPSPDKFNASDTNYVKVAKLLAGEINKIYGKKIINITDDVKAVYRQVAEVLASLASGMHVEFLQVANEIRTTIRNLQTLIGMTKETVNELRRQAAVSSASNDTKVQQLSTALDAIIEEARRQLLMQQNLLNSVIQPTEDNMIQLLRNNKDVYHVIKDINQNKFDKGSILSQIIGAIKGYAVTASVAFLINSALKTVGLTMEQYANEKSTGELYENVYKAIKEHGDNSENLHKILEASELLYKNFPHRVDIKQTFDISKDMDNEFVVGKGEDAFEGFEGGAIDYDSNVRESPIETQIKDQKRLRAIVFETFIRNLGDLCAKFKGSIDAISPKLGNQIPLSDQLDGFRSILQKINMEMLNNRNIYQALIGYYNDALSKSKRDSFIADLKMVNNYVDTIVEMSMYKDSAQLFRDIQLHITAIIALIDRFSEEIASKFGRGEVACVYVEEDITGKGEISGGAGPDPFVRNIAILTRNIKSFNDSVVKFDYYYRAAQIVRNLSQVGAQLDKDSEKHADLDARGILSILEKHKNIYQRIRKDLADTPTITPVANVVGFDDQNKIAAEKQAALDFLDTQWEARKKFWATVEAIDTYMRIFTNDLVKNPEDIKEIKSMLDEIEVINDWYNEGSGNTLSSVFDYFPSFVRGDSVTSDPADSAASAVVYHDPNTIESGEKHVYQQISEKLGNRSDQEIFSALPGNPHLVTIPSYAVRARAQLRSTLDSLGILKNLLSIFVHIGSKFGKDELSKKVFMTPAQIYSNLVEFLQASAFAQGFYPHAIYDAIPKGDAAMPVNVATGGANFNWTFNRGTAPAHGEGIGIMFDLLDNDTAPLGAVMPTYDNNTNIVTIGLSAQDQPNFAANLGGNDSIINFKRHFGVWMRSCIPSIQEWEGIGFQQEDQYFVLILKAMAAKIFTVTGMYNVLDRPAESNALSAIRMIVGGADEPVPKVDEGAVELYLRLPLLLQFYRRIFGFEEAYGDYDPNNKFDEYNNLKGRRDTMIKISMVPDIDSPFAGLIALIFRKNNLVRTDLYSLEDVREVIKEVNSIWQRMQSKYQENAVMNTIYELVAEVNRRYGIISKQERNRYEQEFGYRYDYYDPQRDYGLNPLASQDRYAQQNNAYIPILPGETDDEPQQLSNSEKLLESVSTTPKPFIGINVSEDHKKLVYRFRCAIDKLFEHPSEDYSFKGAIKTTQLKLKSESNDEARFKIVASLIRGTDIYNKTDGLKYVLFHETVVGGLNILSAVHTMLQRFRQHVLLADIDWMADEFVKWLVSMPSEAAGNAANVHAGPGGGAHDQYAVNVVEFMRYLIGKFKNDKFGMDDETIGVSLGKTFGYEAAVIALGGHYAGGVAGNEFMLKHKEGVPALNINKNAVNLVKRNNTPAGAAPPFNGLPADARFMPGGPQNANAPDYAGLLGLLIGLSPDDVKRGRDELKAKKNTVNRRIFETIIRFLFDREYVMRQLLETIYGISNDLQGLVEFKFETNRIQLNFSGLKSLIEEMFANINTYLDLLRPYIANDIIAKYTNKLNPGSLYWLQEQLNEKIIFGRPPSIVDESGASTRVSAYNERLLQDKPYFGYKSLNYVTVRLNAIWADLTREWSVDGSKLSDAQWSKESGKLAQPSKTSFDKVFAELLFYDSARPDSGIMPGIREGTSVSAAPNFQTTDALRLVDFKGENNQYEPLAFISSANGRFLDTRYLARFKNLYSWGDEYLFNRSSMISFNQLIGKFIQSFYDPANQKIYSNLISHFAQGAFSRNIIDQNFTYPDTQPCTFAKFKDGIGKKIDGMEILRPNIRGYDPDVGQNTNNSILRAALRNMARYGVGVGDRILTLNADGSGGDPSAFDPTRDIYNINNSMTYDWIPAVAGYGNYNKIDIMSLYVALHVGALAIRRIFERLVGRAGNFAVSQNLLNTLDAVFYNNAAPPVHINAAGAFAAAPITIGDFIAKYKAATNGAAEVWVVAPVVAATPITNGGVAAATDIPTIENILDKIFLYRAPGGAAVAKSSMDRLIHIFNTWFPLADAMRGGGAATVAVANGGLGAFPVYDQDFAATNAANVIQGAPVLNSSGLNYIDNDIIKKYADTVAEEVLTSDTIQPENRVNANFLYPPFGGTIRAAAIMNIRWARNTIGQTRTERERRVDEFTDMAFYLGQMSLSIFSSRIGANRLGYLTHRQTAASILSDLNTARQKIIQSVASIPQVLIQESKLDDWRNFIKFEDATNLKTDPSFIRDVDPSDLDPNGNIVLVAETYNAHPRNARLYEKLGPHQGTTAEWTQENNVVFGRRWDPDNDHVLFTSLSVILKSLISSRTVGQQQLYLIENITDVPMYMKEKYRANLPAFRGLFKELIGKCEFLKTFMNRAELDLRRDWGMIGAAQVNINPWPGNLKAPYVGGNQANGMPSTDVKARFAGIANSVIQGCSALINSCEQVLREIGDEPKYMELYQASIKDYKMQYGVDPLMPISSSLYALRNTNNSNYTDFLPIHSAGDEKFKLMYAIRGLINRPTEQITAEQVPGWTGLVEAFNSISEGKFIVDKAKSDSFLKCFVKLARYVYDLKHNKGLLAVLNDFKDFYGWIQLYRGHLGNIAPNLSSDELTRMINAGMFAKHDLLVTKNQFDRTIPRAARITGPNGNCEFVYQDGLLTDPSNNSDVSLFDDFDERSKDASLMLKTPIPVYSLNHSLADTLRLTESNLKEDRIRDIVDHITRSNAGKNTPEVQNIIDLNIVPINVHALMRDVPLVNIYNYAYTFDRMIVELYYGMQNLNTRRLISELCDNNNRLKKVTNAKDMLIQLLLDPYLDVTSNIGAADAEQYNRPDDFNGINYYEKFVKKVLVGATGNELGRPKFISDQIFNKVIFGELYQDRAQYREQGPSAVPVGNNDKENIVNAATELLHYGFRQTDVLNTILFGSLGVINTVALDNALRVFSRSIIKYLASDFPSKSFGDLYERLYMNLDDGGNNLPPNTLWQGHPGKAAHGAGNDVFNTLQARATVAGASNLALVGTLLGYIIYYPTVQLFKDLRTSTQANALRSFVQLIAFLYTGITRMNFNGAAQYLSISYTDANGNQANATNSDEAFFGLYNNSINLAQRYARGAPAQQPAIGTRYTSLTAARAVNAGIFENVITGGDGGFRLSSTQDSIAQEVFKAITRLDIQSAFIQANIAAGHAIAIWTSDERQVTVERYLRAKRISGDSVQVFSISPTLHYLSTGSARFPEDSEDSRDTLDNQFVDSSQVHAVDVKEISSMLYKNGILRFNTVIVRNLIFLVNLYRSIRYKLQKDLFYDADRVIKKSAPILSPDSTEFSGNAIDMERLKFSKDPRLNRYLY